MTTPGDGAVSDESGRLEFILEVGDLAWWEMDCRTGAVRFHRRKAEMLGYEPESFTHYTDFTALLHPDDLEPAMQAMRSHLTGDAPDYRIDYRIRHRDGDYRWFQDVGRISARDEEGRPLAVTGLVTDLTGRRRVNEVLRESEARFRKLFHGHAAVKLLIDPETGTIVDANDAAARFYGWTVDELKQMRIQHINELPPDVLAQKMAVAASSSNASFEFRHRRADGSVRDVEVFSNKIEFGGRACLYSIIHDISDRKHAERELRASETRYRLVAENVSDVIWILDLETRRFRYVSPSIVRLRGFTADEAMAQSVEAALTASSYSTITGQLPARIREYESGVTCTYTDVVEQPRKDGSRVWVEVHSRYVMNTETGHLEVFGVSRDITQRRRAEEALRTAHGRLRHAEEVARFGHWEFSLDDKVMHASDGAIGIYGFATNEIPLSDVQRCAMPEHRASLDAALRRLLEEHEPYDVEFFIRRASDGQSVAVHSWAEYDPRRRMVFGVVQDISDRKRVETEREALIQELKGAVEHIKTLKGIVPICAGCKKIRDDRGYWEQVEAYVSRHTEATFSHGICPDCLVKLYPSESNT